MTDEDNMSKNQGFKSKKTWKPLWWHQWQMKYMPVLALSGNWSEMQITQLTPDPHFGVRMAWFQSCLCHSLPRLGQWFIFSGSVTEFVKRWQ